MHPLGKVLLFFAIVGSGFAIYYSAKLLDRKQEWMKKADAREKELAEITSKNRANQLIMRTREATLHKVTLGWDRYWNDVRLNVAQLENAPPTVTVGVGNDKRLKEKDRVFLFSVSGEKAETPAEGAPPAGATPEAPAKPAGSSRYLGAFSVTAVAPDAPRSALAVDGRPTPEQLATLNSGSVRVRTLIPAELEMPFKNLQKDILIMDERIAETQGELKTQQTRFESAQAEQTAREKEIEGNAELKGRTLPSEVIDGLIASLAAEEELRNSALELVKSLQTRLKDTVERTAVLRGEIKQLVRSLPQPGSPQSALRELSPR